MIGKYPVVEQAERSALARAVARSRRMQQAMTDRACLGAEISTSSVGGPPPARAGVEFSAAGLVARGTATRTNPPGGGERASARSASPAAAIDSGCR